MKKTKQQLDREIKHALQRRSGAAKKSIESVVEDALSAFWASVAAAYPQATTGDMTPSGEVRLKRAAIAAVEEWVEYNVP